MLLEKLKEVDDFLVKAEALAIRLVDNIHAKVRESPVSAVLPRVQWVEGDLSARRSSYINGDGGRLVLTRMSAEVTYGPISVANGVTETLPCFRTQRGWVTHDTALSDNAFGPFDFEWNFSVGRRQAYYVRDDWMSSQMLAGQDRGQFLEFKTPIVLNAGESIEGFTRAINTHGNEPSASRVFCVKLRFDGYRG